MVHPYPKTSLLLERWRDGHREALGELLEAHEAWIHRKVRQCMTPVLRSRLETGDFVQHAMLEFLEHAPRFTIENGKLFRGLMFKIVLNTMREEGRWWMAARRHIARERPLAHDSLLDLEGTGRTPVQEAVDREQEAWIRMGIEFLKPDDRKIVVLHDYDALKPKHLAAEMGKSEAAVRMQYLRACERLTRILMLLRSGSLERLIREDEDQGLDDGPSEGRSADASDSPA